MALDSHVLELVIRLRRDGYFDGPLSLIEIGAQQLSNEFLEVRDRRFYGDEHSTNVDGDHPIEIVEGIVIYHSADENAGIVH